MRLPFTQESDFRRERDFGQKISATIEFIGAHWRPLGRVLLYLVLPAALLQNILAVVVQRQLSGALTGAMQNQKPGMGGVLGTQKAMWGSLTSSPLYWLNAVLGTALVVMLVLSIYGYVVTLLNRQTPDGPEVTVPEVWAVVKREFFSTFFSTWGLALIMVLGFAFLFFPGMYLSVALSLFYIVRMAEGTGFGDTLSRCLGLTRGKWWSTFGLIFVMIMMLYVVLLGVGIVMAMLSGGLTGMVHAATDQSPLYTIVLTSLNSLFMLLLYPPMLLVLAFQYFNLVERKDGVGLHQLVNTLGQTAAPQASNSAYRPDEEGEY